MRKYEYFYNSDKIITHIDDAIKGKIYTSKEGVEFFVRDGGINIKHYAIKDRLSSLSIGFSGGGESPEHYNAKMKIAKELKYYDTIFNKEVHFSKVVPELKIKDKIPDLTCYDEKDNIVMFIEIKYSNEKNDDDLEKLSKNEKPVIEIDINDGNKCKHLILPTLLEANKQESNRIQRLFKESAKGFKEKIRRQDREFQELEQKISKVYSYIDGFKEGIREEKDETIRRINGDIRFFREGIQSNGTERTREISRNIRERKFRNRERKSEIRRIQSRIKSSNRQIKNIDESAVEKLEEEFTRIKREVKDRKNNTKEVAELCKIKWFKNRWMGTETSNKLQEIRYWCS